MSGSRTSGGFRVSSSKLLTGTVYGGFLRDPFGTAGLCLGGSVSSTNSYYCWVRLDVGNRLVLTKEAAEVFGVKPKADDKDRQRRDRPGAEQINGSSGCRPAPSSPASPHTGKACRTGPRTPRSPEQSVSYSSFPNYYTVEIIPGTLNFRCREERQYRRETLVRPLINSVDGGRAKSDYNVLLRSGPLPRHPSRPCMIRASPACRTRAAR